MFVDFLMMDILTTVRYAVLICISQIISDIKPLLMCLGPPVCLLWRNVYLGLPPIFRLGCLVFCYWIALAVHIILEIKPLSVTLFVNIFSQSIGCLFILFMVSFTAQKLIRLIRSHLFIFASISTVLGDRPKKTLLHFTSENVLPTGTWTFESDWPGSKS